MTATPKLDTVQSADARRKALRTMAAYTAGASLATFTLSARAQSVTNCGANGQTDPSDGAGGNNCTGGGGGGNGGGNAKSSDVGSSLGGFF